MFATKECILFVSCATVQKAISGYGQIGAQAHGYTFQGSDCLIDHLRLFLYHFSIRSIKARLSDLLSYPYQRK